MFHRWTRTRRDLLMENLLQRQQLAVYARQPKRPRPRNEVRLCWSVVARTWPPWRLRLHQPQPETVIRWHRVAWRRYWTWRSRRRRPGRPRIEAELRELFLLLARENPRRGFVHVVGELRAPGFPGSTRTVRRYRDQARRRPPPQSWQTFPRNHAPHTWAVELFTMRTIAMRTLGVVAFISHDGRRVVLVNVTRHPTAAWLWRRLIDATPWGSQPRVAIRDRGFGADFVRKASGIAYSSSG